MLSNLCFFQRILIDIHQILFAKLFESTFVSSGIRMAYQLKSNIYLNEGI